MSDRCKFHIPSIFRGQVADMLDQQFWFLGRDVRASEGNLLLELGFEQTRPPADCKAATQYALNFPDRSQLRLWGFGLWYSRRSEKGVFLRRSEFAPRLCHLSAPIWRAEDLPALEFPSNETQINHLWHDLAIVFDWFAVYERWVINRCGLAYRISCLNQWNKRCDVEAQRIADFWEFVAQVCRECASSVDDTRASISRYPLIR